MTSSSLTAVAAAVASTTVLLSGCTRSQTTATPQATVAASPSAAPWTVEQRTEAGLLALEKKKEKLRTRGPKSFDSPQEAHEFFLRQRLSLRQPTYPVEEMRQVGRLIDEVLTSPEASTIDQVRRSVHELSSVFPLYQSATSTA